MKKLLYFLIPVQIIILVLSPRFGWNIHNSDATTLSFKGVSYEDGDFHCIYENDNNTVDISYPNLFSKNFSITMNSTNEYSMKVKLDGESIESEQNMLPGIANDIVWKDTFGIMYWRCILTVAMSLISMKVFRYANENIKERKWAGIGASIIYVVSILISLRVIF